MSQRIEDTILRNLIANEGFARKTLPFLKEEYFKRNEDRLLFQEIKAFILKYNALPTYDSLRIEIDNVKGASEDTVKTILSTLNEFVDDKTKTNDDWLVDSTEKFCQESAIYNSITHALEIMNGTSKLDKGAIPGLLQDALAVSFNPSVGHDFINESQDRYSYYHRTEEKVPFDLELFNKATKNGITKKTLNLIMGGVHSGKTLFLCHLSSAYLLQGKKVLYITLEMSEKEIAKRIDANTLNIAIDDLMELPKDLYEKKIKKLRQKTQGDLIIKEFAATSSSVLHFKALLNELNLKKGFVPDVIMIDYLNLCASCRLKSSNASDLYTWVKSIAEEVRGLGQEVDIPIWSATQLNRAGFGSSDPGMTDTAESFGLPATLDLQWVIIVSDEMKRLNQIMVKQLKNRYEDMDKMLRFVVGVDKSKMRLYDLEPEAQTDIVDNSQEPVVVPKFKGKDKFKGLKT